MDRRSILLPIGTLGFMKNKSNFFMQNINREKVDIDCFLFASFEKPKLSPKKHSLNLSPCLAESKAH